MPEGRGERQKALERLIKNSQPKQKRKFNGVWYRVYNSYGSKSKAEADAKYLRTKGYKCRVFHNAGFGVWEVFIA